MHSNCEMSLDDADNPLAVEIRQEMAGAYFAACGKMVEALEALKAFDQGCGVLTGDARRRELIDEAAERVHFVVIQREAMKLSHSEGFFDDYGVPVEVRTRMGARRSANKLSAIL